VTDDLAIPSDQLPDELAAKWWAFALRGLAAIVFGVLAIVVPGLTLIALVLLFAAYAIADGLFGLIAGFRARAGSPDWWIILAGIASVLVGVLALIWPGPMTFALLVFIGSWAIVTGVFEIAAAYRFRDRLRNEWLMALDGFVSIAFGLFILVAPGAGALALVWLIGAYAIASGIVLLALAVRLYQRHRDRAGAPRRGAATAA
jgi:uncharacterized membrane protein HdeD (DUF308 family)